MPKFGRWPKRGDLKMSYGKEIQSEFAKAYARMGNGKHALLAVLGDERANRMKPHTLRAKASRLLNHYRVLEQIEQEKAEMQQRGETLPHYRGRTVRTDLISDEAYEPIKIPPHPVVIPRGMKGLLKEMERLKRSTIKTPLFSIRNRKIR